TSPARLSMSLLPVMPETSRSPAVMRIIRSDRFGTSMTAANPIRGAFRSTTFPCAPFAVSSILVSPTRLVSVTRMRLSRAAFTSNSPASSHSSIRPPGANGCSLTFSAASVLAAQHTPSTAASARVLMRLLLELEVADRESRAKGVLALAGVGHALREEAAFRVAERTCGQIADADRRIHLRVAVRIAGDDLQVARVHLDVLATGDVVHVEVARAQPNRDVGHLRHLDDHMEGLAAVGRLPDDDVGVPVLDDDVGHGVAHVSRERDSDVVVTRCPHFVVAGFEMDVHLAAADERLVLDFGLGEERSAGGETRKYAGRQHGLKSSS